MKEQIQQRIRAFEARFMIHAREGLCVDWMAASNHDKEGFRQYVKDRRWLQDFRHTT